MNDYCILNTVPPVMREDAGIMETFQLHNTSV